jgi:hypothetical protein
VRVTVACPGYDHGIAAFGGSSVAAPAASDAQDGKNEDRQEPGLTVPCAALENLEGSGERSKTNDIP